MSPKRLGLLGIVIAGAALVVAIAVLRPPSPQPPDAPELPPPPQISTACATRFDAVLRNIAQLVLDTRSDRGSRSSPDVVDIVSGEVDTLTFDCSRAVVDFLDLFKPLDVRTAEAPEKLKDFIVANLDQIDAIRARLAPFLPRKGCPDDLNAQLTILEAELRRLGPVQDLIDSFVEGLADDCVLRLVEAVAGVDRSRGLTQARTTLKVYIHEHHTYLRSLLTD